MNARLLAAVAAVTATLALSACVATGAQPDEAIPPALLGSDLGILEASADKSTSGFSLTVSVSFVVERDELSADDLRQIIGIAVDNTHITNVETLRVSGFSDEIDPDAVVESHVELDLETPADDLGLELEDGPLSDAGTIELRWEDARALD